MPDERPADTIAAAIVEDLRDRSGLGDEWEQIPEDIRAEIVVEWARIVRDGLPLLHPGLPRRALAACRARENWDEPNQYLYDLAARAGKNVMQAWADTIIDRFARAECLGLSEDLNTALARRLEGIDK